MLATATQASATAAAIDSCCGSCAFHGDVCPNCNKAIHAAYAQFVVRLAAIQEIFKGYVGYVGGSKVEIRIALMAQLIAMERDN